MSEGEDKAFKKIKQETYIRTITGVISAIAIGILLYFYNKILDYYNKILYAFKATPFEGKVLIIILFILLILACAVIFRQRINKGFIFKKNEDFIKIEKERDELYIKLSEAKNFKLKAKNLGQKMLEDSQYPSMSKKDLEECIPSMLDYYYFVCERLADIGIPQPYKEWKETGYDLLLKMEKYMHRVGSLLSEGDVDNARKKAEEMT
ncbi:hypothetical protein B488_04820 [Liberibacter crescens BT-1]|uniref:Uncharacterized protein n=1 Tax=Liberibacter crescens (strain BT-1) TaxID=1215343 RepID=L0ESI8_LIBCB|nr:hypothetical protein [Liberibacter crescens]AGA64474.1 hypothetical protein B488_04820 [Liberibacter crescens BT-1]AMC12642.1 hypothetical protein RL73_02520 [Liberibacter crescens]